MKHHRDMHKARKSSHTHTKEVAEKVIALLDEDEVEYLEAVAGDASRSSKKKLSLEDVIHGLVDATLAVRIPANGTSSQDELVQRVLETCRLNVDRRRFPRIRKNLLVRYRDTDTLADFDHCRTVEMSFGGFRMEVRNRKVLPRVGEELEFQVNDENELLEPIRFLGKVVWVRERNREPGYEVGVRLTHLEKEHEKRFRDCLTSRLKA